MAHSIGRVAQALIPLFSNPLATNDMKTSTDYWQTIAAKSALRQCKWTSGEELLATLSGLDVASHADLIQQVPTLSRPQRIAAIRLFSILKVREAGLLLIECWLLEDTDERWEAARALSDVQCRRAYKRLRSIIHGHPDTRRRKEACHILAFAFDPFLLKAFQQIYAAESYPFAVRAQAAEGLANLLGYLDRRSRRYRQTLALLLPGLEDPTPEIRFWTCFALGNMRATEALPELQRLVAEDDAFCPGWWYVRDEASDAICHIQGKPWPDRVPGQFPVASAG
ncbi:MAG: hypothetical protein JWN14_2399 [Chthonomonadales bacterium]|nr:hypothetical protein [Chthonomonadales bacterium]